MSATGFIDFLRKTPTQFHVVKTCIQQLQAAGFTRLSEKEVWDDKVQPNGRYFFTRNETSLFAFCVGKEFQKGDGFAIVAAHTDSPSLKLKPISKQESKGHLMLGVEMYGGGKFYTWADRDLSLAGRLIVGKCNRSDLSSARKKAALKPRYSISIKLCALFHRLPFISPMKRSERVTEWSSTRKRNFSPSLVLVPWTRRKARWTFTIATPKSSST